MIPHRLDPPAQIAAAEAIGRARALLPDPEPVPDDLVDGLVRAGQRAGYRGDLSGLRCRLAWAIRDAEAAERARRDRAARFVRQTIEPLLDRWAPPHHVFAAAAEEARGHGDALRPWEVQAIVEEAMARRLAARPGRGRRHAA